MKDEKILNEEVLSEEELEGVAGGSLSAMVKDTKFLHALGLMDPTMELAGCVGSRTGLQRTCEQS